MVKILFQNQKESIVAKVTKISDHVIQIMSKTPVNLSGFILMNDYGSVFGKYEKFNTLYRVVDGGYQLSDNGSIYIDSDVPEIPITPEATLEEVKAYKIREIEDNIMNNITSGISFNDDNFTYRSDEMSNIRHKYEDSIYTGKSVILTSSSGKLVKLSTEEIKTLYTNIEKNRIENESRKEPLIQMINDATSKKEVNAISVSSELTGKYLESYKNYVSQQEELLNETMLLAESKSIQNNIMLLSFPDNQALLVKELYNKWEDDKVGYKYNLENPEDSRRSFNGNLWKLNKNHEKQEYLYPGSDPTLWTLVIDENAGSI